VRSGGVDGQAQPPSLERLIVTSGGSLPAPTLAAAVASFGLPNRFPLPGRTLTEAVFAGFLSTVEHHRLLGLAAAAVKADALHVTDRQRDDLERGLQAWLAHDLRVERLLVDVLDVLDRAGIPARALKGVAYAHLDYPDPMQRVFGDVDLLVRSEDVGPAVDILTGELGATREQPELRPGFDRRFGKEVLLRTADGLELDLHRMFVDGALGLTMTLPDLFAPPERFALAGHAVDALPRPLRFLHACYAAALGDWPPRLISLRDVAQILAGGDVDLEDTLRIARRWQAEAVVARALTHTWDALALSGSSPWVEWAGAFVPSARERMLLRAHEGSGRSYSRHAAALFVLPSVASKATYLRAIALPQRAYLVARGRTPGGHVSYAVRRLRELARPSR
jgi:hypothetical protein